MKTTILVKTQERFRLESKFFPHSYIRDVDGELNAETLKDLIKECIGNAISWYVEDIKILATTP
jgi:hypothetical protein